MYIFYTNVQKYVVGKIFKMFLKQGCIYLIKNTVKYRKIWYIFWWIECSKEQYLFETEIICNIINVTID